MLLLLSTARFALEARSAQAKCEVIAEGFQLAEAELPRTPADSGGGPHRRRRAGVREGGDEDVAEVALEAGDLQGERSPCRALVTGDPRPESGRPEPQLRLGRAVIDGDHGKRR